MNFVGYITRDAYATWLKKEPLLFASGSSVLYSNFGFDLLSLALSSAAKKPYPELLDEHITRPLNMKETVFALSEEQKKRLTQGHDSDGKALPDVPDRPEGEGRSKPTLHYGEIFRDLWLFIALTGCRHNVSRLSCNARIAGCGFGSSAGSSDILIYTDP